MDPRDGFAGGKIIPSELLEEMIGVIIDLYPGHPCIPKAQAILDAKMSDHYSRHAHMEAKLNLMTHINKVDVNLGSVTGRPVELPGTIELHGSVPKEELIDGRTGAEKWHECIKAKFQRNVVHMDRATKYYEMTGSDIMYRLNARSDLPSSIFTLKSLYWIFESTPGYWEGVWENCFDYKLC